MTQVLKRTESLTGPDANPSATKSTRLTATKTETNATGPIRQSIAKATTRKPHPASAGPNIRAQITGRWLAVRENTTIRRRTIAGGWILGVVAASTFPRLLWGEWVGLGILLITTFLAITTYSKLARNFRFEGVTVTGAFVDAANERRTNAPYQVYELQPGDPTTKALWKQALRSERRIFRDADGNRWWQILLAFFPYRHTTTIALLVDQRNPVPLPAAYMRIGSGSSQGQATTNAMKTWKGKKRDVNQALQAAGIDPRSPYSPRSADVSMVGSHPYYRRPSNSGLERPVRTDILLYAWLSQWCARNGVTDLFAIMNRFEARILHGLTGTPFDYFLESDFPKWDYFGSKGSRPMYCNIEEWRRRLKLNHPEFEDLMFGDGLAPWVTMP